MNLEMPVGIDDFKMAREGYYLVDKTLFIRDIINHHSQATLITRPRRFGKTLTLSMLAYFFSIEHKEETGRLFDGLAIAEAPGDYMKYRGSRPVIFMTLKGVDNADWESLYGIFTQVVQMEFQKHRYLLQSGVLKAEDEAYFERILTLTGSPADYQMSLLKLSRFLALYYHANPIILLDEYDAPIQHAYEHGFYESAVAYFKVWLNNGLKSNPYLGFAILTGVLRIAKESIFSGLNNLEVSTLTGNSFSTVFGFTEDEVRQMAHDLGEEKKLPEIRAWYDGYTIGGKAMYNPWSVISYFKNHCDPMPYWVNTSSNDILAKLLAHAGETRIRQIHDLLAGKTVNVTLNENVIYQDIGRDKSALFTMLLTTGYLTVAGKSNEAYNRFALRIPNEEVRMVYSIEILNHLAEGIDRDTFDTLFDALLAGDARGFESGLRDILLHVASAFDTAGKEVFYHGFLLGMTALFLGKDYEVSSNRESGYGRYDLAILPKKSGRPGVLMEFKVAESENQLETRAREAAKQIEDKAYAVEFSKRGIRSVWKYGIAFCGKKVKVVAAEQQ